MQASFQPGVSIDSRTRPPASAHPSAGVTLIDVMFGLVILSTSMLGLCSLYVANEKTSEAAVQEALITNSLRNMAETMRSTPFSDIASTYQGYTFYDIGMNATGAVTIYMDEEDTSPDAQALGFPRDLDGDGVANKTVTTGYFLLPVKIDVTFPGSQTQSLYFFLSQDD